MLTINSIEEKEADAVRTQASAKVKMYEKRK